MSPPARHSRALLGARHPGQAAESIPPMAAAARSLPGLASGRVPVARRLPVPRGICEGCCAVCSDFYALPELVNVPFGTSTHRRYTNRELTGNDLSRTSCLCVQRGKVSWKQNSVFTEDSSEELALRATAESRLYLTLSGCCSAHLIIGCFPFN